VEDFINDRSVNSLLHILKLLKQFDQKALFFITGNMSEKLIHFPKIMSMLEEHEIGYHSTSHSVHPNIFEYTDVENYQQAYKTSLERETSHINPTSGQIEGIGGIEQLRTAFPNKNIDCFRAPGFSWSPPHLEALTCLGLKFDFSAQISRLPISFKQITFYPLPRFVDSVPIRKLLYSMRKNDVIVLDFHPNNFVNQIWWDSFYFPKTNPKILHGVAARPENDVATMFAEFSNLLRTVNLMKKTRMIQLCNKATKVEKNLDPKKLNLQKVYKALAAWPIQRFNYEPRFIIAHLSTFFKP
jgi:peptidoglycan/xylan/chitin deacetylase (PgdA/CDA1 family)